VLQRMVPRIFDDGRTVVGRCAHDMVPHIELIEQLGDLVIQAPPLDIEMQQAPMLAVKQKYLGQRRDASVLAERARPAKAKLLQIRPGEIAYISPSLEDLIEHVVVKANQYAVLRFADVDFVSVGIQLERRPIRFQRVFVGKLAGTSMTDNLQSSAALGDLLH